jgi:hypothetical protein
MSSADIYAYRGSKKAAALAKAFIKISKPPFVFDSKKHIDTRLYEAANLAVGLLSGSDEDDDLVATLYRRNARKAFLALLPEVEPYIFHFPFLTRAFCEDLLEYINLPEVQELWVYNTDGQENEKSGARDLLFQVYPSLLFWLIITLVEALIFHDGI